MDGNRVAPGRQHLGLPQSSGPRGIQYLLIQRRLLQKSLACSGTMVPVSPVGDGDCPRSVILAWGFAKSDTRAVYNVNMPIGTW